MPTLAALTINSTDANIEEIYDESICDPTADPPDTLEVLNGGLTAANFTNGLVVPPWAAQPGAFIRAVQVPFDRWEIIYAKQMEDDTDDNMVVVASLSTRVFIPWDCNAVIVSWQAMWRHDATIAENATPSTAAEQWTARFLAGGTAIGSIQRTLTATRSTTAASFTFNTAPVSDEDRWPYSCATVVLDSSSWSAVCAKGYQTFICRVKARIYDDDPEESKLIIPTGAITVIAVRG
jgi:hypothetical protein